MPDVNAEEDAYQCELADVGHAILEQMGEGYVLRTGHHLEDQLFVELEQISRAE